MSENNETPKPPKRSTGFKDANAFLEEVSKKEDEKLDSVKPSIAKSFGEEMEKVPNLNVYSLPGQGGLEGRTHVGGQRHTNGHNTFLRQDSEYRGTDGRGLTPKPAVIVPEKK